MYGVFVMKMCFVGFLGKILCQYNYFTCNPLILLQYQVNIIMYSPHYCLYFSCATTWENLLEHQDIFVFDGPFLFSHKNSDAASRDLTLITFVGGLKG